MDPLQIRPLSTSIDLNEATASSSRTIYPAISHSQPQFQPTAGNTNQHPSSIACLHLYANDRGRYPKMGLWCNSDMRVDLNAKVVLMEVCQAHAEVMAQRDGLGGDDRDSVCEKSDIRVKRTASLLPAEHANKSQTITEPIGAGQKSTPTRTSNLDDRPAITEGEAWSLSTNMAKKSKHVEDSADEVVGEDATCSRSDSDDEYVPGPIRAAKGKSRIGGKVSSKSSKNRDGDYSSWKPSGYNKRRRIDNMEGSSFAVSYPSLTWSDTVTPDLNIPQATSNRTDTPAYSERPVKKRKLLEESNVAGTSGSSRDDEKFDGLDLANRYGIRPQVGEKTLPYGEVTLGKRKRAKTRAPEQTAVISLEREESGANKRRRVDATEASSDISDDSDEDFIPGPTIRNKVGSKKIKKTEARGRTRPGRGVEKINPAFSSSNPEPSGVGSSTQLMGSTTESEVPETGEGEVGDDWPNVVRERGGGLKCIPCNMVMKNRGDMNRHMESLSHKPKSHVCDVCNGTFTRTDSLKRHVAKKHGKVKAYK